MYRNLLLLLFVACAAAAAVDNNLDPGRAAEQGTARANDTGVIMEPARDRMMAAAEAEVISIDGSIRSTTLQLQQAQAKVAKAVGDAEKANAQSEIKSLRQSLTQLQGERKAAGERAEKAKKEAEDDEE